MGCGESVVMGKGLGIETGERSESGVVVESGGSVSGRGRSKWSGGQPYRAHLPGATCLAPYFRNHMEKVPVFGVVGIGRRAVFFLPELDVKSGEKVVSDLLV